MTEGRDPAIKALVEMVAQYLTVGEELDTHCMSAGENALRVLADEGLVAYDGGRCGSWTKAGRRLLDR